MTWTVLTKRSFESAFKALPQDYQRRVAAFLVEMDALPDEAANLPRVGRVHGQRPYYRARFGKYRLGFEIDHEAKEVVLWFVGSRGDFYKRFPPR